MHQSVPLSWPWLTCTWLRGTLLCMEADSLTELDVAESILNISSKKAI